MLAVATVTVAICCFYGNSQPWSDLHMFCRRWQPIHWFIWRAEDWRLWPGPVHGGWSGLQLYAGHYTVHVARGQSVDTACYCVFIASYYCLQCFDAAGWAAGRASGLKKTERSGAGMGICLEWGADLHMAQWIPLPLTVSCFSKIQIGFTFLVPAHPGSPRQRAVKQVCVVVSK